MFPLVVSALFVLGSLVIDAGFVRGAKRQAVAEANAAALDGARALDLGALRATGERRVNPVAASQRVRAFLGPTGHDGEVRVQGARVTVTVRFEQRTPLLTVIGTSGMTVRGTGSARLVAGVEGPEP